MKTDAAELGEDEEAAAGQEEVLGGTRTDYLVDDKEKTEDLETYLSTVVILPS